MSFNEEEIDIVHEVTMTLDEVAMAKSIEELDESVEELIEKFDGDYDEILNYLSNKYDVYFN